MRRWNTHKDEQTQTSARERWVGKLKLNRADGCVTKQFLFPHSFTLLPVSKQHRHLKDHRQLSFITGELLLSIRHMTYQMFSRTSSVGKAQLNSAECMFVFCHLMNIFFLKEIDLSSKTKLNWQLHCKHANVHISSMNSTRTNVFWSAGERSLSWIEF